MHGNSTVYISTLLCVPGVYPYMLYAGSHGLCIPNRQYSFVAKLVQRCWTPMLMIYPRGPAAWSPGKRGLTESGLIYQG
jgi:hypothetical protein